MRKYSKGSKNKFKDLINEINNNNNINRRQFAEEKVLPFLFELLDEIVSNDGLEKIEHEFIEDAGAKMAIRKTFFGNKFCIEENNFFEKWSNRSDLKYALETDIRAVFHEVRHLKQNKLMARDNILKLSPFSIIYAKEEMIALFDYGFYRKNHGQFLIEIEAYNKALTESAEFVSSAMPNTDYATEYVDLSNPDVYTHTSISGYFVDSQYGVENKSYFITDKFDKVLKEIPADQLHSVFEDYPVLKLAYNEDGTKKSIEEILSMHNDIINSNLKVLKKTINVDDYKTTIENHINKTFATIISSDKDLSEGFKNYLQDREKTPNSTMLNLE